MSAHSMKLKKKESFLDKIILNENEEMVDLYFTIANELFILTNFFNIWKFNNFFTMDNEEPKLVFTINKTEKLNNIKDTKLSDKGIISFFFKILKLLFFLSF